MAGGIFLLRVPRVARFLITAGRDDHLELEPGATARDAAGFVLGTAFGILLHQRGAMVLHGAAAAKDGRAWPSAVYRARVNRRWRRRSAARGYWFSPTIFA